MDDVELDERLTQERTLLDLPSGTVTFLFTDIEGSTELLTKLRDRYAEVVRHHRRLIRESCEKANGREIDTQGDAFFIAFARVKDALAAAVWAQRSIADHDWPDAVRVRVRMGIHTGEPAIGHDGYLGLDVVRAARIAAAAHGGQILLSQTARGLFDEDDLVGVVVRDLGEYGLKDIGRPERIFQVAIDGLETEFPPLRTERKGSLEPGEHAEELERAAEHAVAEPRKRRHWLVAAIGALAVAAVAVGSLLWRGDGGESGLAVAPANSLAVVAADTGKISAAVQTGESPGYLAVGAGALWVTNEGDETLQRIDPKRRTVTATVGLGSTPTDVEVGFGSVWVATRGELIQVDPRTASIVNRFTPEGVRAFPGISAARGLVEVTRNALWYAWNVHVARIDPATNKTVAQITLQDDLANSLTATPDAVWVQGDQSVSRIDVRSNAVVATIPFAVDPYSGCTCLGTSVSAFGSVWTAKPTEDKVWRIDPSANIAADTVAVGHKPSGLTASGRWIWVAGLGDGTVWRIDPRSKTASKLVDVGPSAEDIVAIGNELWVSVDAGDPVAGAEPR
jgi:class 3 adenylate cyclase